MRLCRDSREYMSGSWQRRVRDTHIMYVTHTWSDSPCCRHVYVTTHMNSTHTPICDTAATIFKKLIEFVTTSSWHTCKEHTHKHTAVSSICHTWMNVWYSGRSTSLFQRVRDTHVKITHMNTLPSHLYVIHEWTYSGKSMSSWQRVRETHKEHT